MQIYVTDLSIPELSIYHSLSENRLRRYFEPEPGIFICESSKVIRRALDAGYEPLSILTSITDPDEEAEYVFSRCPDIPVYTAEENILKDITGFSLTEGILCAMRRRALPNVGEILSGKRYVAVLEDVENPTNVGAIFRSAAALGVEAVILTHGCADPLYRRAARVSMGTVFQIPWTFMGKDYDTAQILKDGGYTTVAMALSPEAVSVNDPKIKAADKLAVILGNECYGLKEDTISGSDIVAMIPMKHGVDSLNVAAASAVVFWELSVGKRSED
ncbi:MAG: RNA methyltransferase [Lachnospiraceae bacterium]|nr:RNA methyltransferase [Lachnospiraceae bacterium]